MIETEPPVWQGAMSAHTGRMQAKSNEARRDGSVFKRTNYFFTKPKYMNQQRSLRVGDELELTIETLAFGGEGVAKIPFNGKFFTVFVEDVVPGDRVKVRITRKKSKWARGFVKELLKPSDLRLQPRCKHFGSDFARDGKPNLSKNCGGCAWQFLSYDQQLLYKERQVREAIRHLGGIENEVVLPIIGMKEPWFYRNKMEFSFSRSQSGEITLGLHLKRRHYDVTELEECFLLAPYVGELVQGVRHFFQGLQIDPEIKLESLTVREGKNTGEIMLILSAEGRDKKIVDAFSAWALDFFSKNNLKLTSLYFINIHNKPGKPKLLSDELLYGKPTIREELRLEGGRALSFQISPLAFFQPNTSQAQVLYQKALEAAALSGNEIVYDLFCGTGTIGLFCTKQARKVYGIDINVSAIENARLNATANGITNIEFLAGDTDKNLSKITEKPDVVMVDPPRNGLEPKVVEKIIELAPQRIVYVSCNPSTLARDIKLFSNRYELQSVQPVDMFPQTYHIENVAGLRLMKN
jgi:23S rRNA (uracil1939-C5)-methyltransferase